MPFDDENEGQTHSENDGCGDPHHNAPPSAYVIGKVFHDPLDHPFEGLAKDDIYIVMENNPVNLAHAKELFKNYKPKDDEILSSHGIAS